MRLIDYDPASGVFTYQAADGRLVYLSADELDAMAGVAP